MRPQTPDLKGLWRSGLRCAVALSLCLVAASAAQAHDSWMTLRADAPTGQWVLELGTGERFPRWDEAVEPSKLQQLGCRSERGLLTPLARAEQSSSVTRWRWDAAGASGLQCWAQTQPADIELSAVKALEYFDEIRPSKAMQQAWQRLQQRGLPFRERFAKSARFDDARSQAPPSPLTVDLLRIDTGTTLTEGDTVRLRLLRHGRPLADQSVQWLHADLARGLWARTNATGELSLRAVLPGFWLLRGTDLRLSAEDPERFESDFFAFVLEVAPR